MDEEYKIVSLDIYGMIFTEDKKEEYFDGKDIEVASVGSSNTIHQFEVEESKENQFFSKSKKFKFFEISDFFRWERPEALIQAVSEGEPEAYDVRGG